MGCFSFKCLCCGRAIKSNSFRGQMVQLFLLKNGIVIERMVGEYDSYGRVFDDSSKIIKEGGTIEYERSKQWETMDWNCIVRLMFLDDIGNGIAAIHKSCIDKNKKFELIPKIRSEDDPNQGWGTFYIDDVRFR